MNIAGDQQPLFVAISSQNFAIRVSVQSFHSYLCTLLQQSKMDNKNFANLHNKLLQLFCKRSLLQDSQSKNNSESKTTGSLKNFLPMALWLIFHTAKKLGL